MFDLKFPKLYSNFFTSNIEKGTDLAPLTAGAAENSGNRLNFTNRKPTFGLGFPKQSSNFLAQILKKLQIWLR